MQFMCSHKSGAMPSPPKKSPPSTSCTAHLTPTVDISIRNRFSWRETSSFPSLSESSESVRICQNHGKTPQIADVDGKVHDTQPSRWRLMAAPLFRLTGLLPPLVQHDLNASWVCKSESISKYPATNPLPSQKQDANGKCIVPLS